MMDATMAEPAVSLAEAQAYLRIESGEEEALLAGLIRSASAMCEQFTGRVLLARPFMERMAASGQWQRLSLTPMRSIGAVAVAGVDGEAVPLGADTYAVDIDSAGDGWVRLTGTSDARLIEVEAVAGMAANANGVPEPLRQGILRLTAHLFSIRDGEGGEPPAAVTALWRPYRRMRLA